MQITVALQFALFAIAAVLACMGLAMTLRRAYRDVALARRSALEARLRPLLLGLLSEDEPDLSDLESVTGFEATVLEALVWQLLPKVRGAAREVLVQWLQDRGAVERARVRTRGRSSVERGKAAEKLGAAGVASTSADVSHLLHDRHADVRIVATRALGKLGDADAVPELLRALDGERPVPAGIVTMALIHIGPSAVHNLTAGLGDRSEIVRGVCADILGMHGAIGASRWLIALLEHDRSDDVRCKAAEALGRIGVPQSIDPLCRHLAPGYAAEVRIACASALGQVGGKDAVDALHNTVLDDDEKVASAAAEALAGMGAPGLQRLQLLVDTGGQGGTHASEWLMREQVVVDRKRSRSGVAGARP